jgi:sugar lactone lactonase YvrE
MSPNMKHALVLVVLGLLILGSFSHLTFSSEARIAKDFANGDKQVDLEFPTGTEAYTVNVSIPKAAKFSSALVGVTGLPLGSVGNYPRSPALDLDSDGTIDWKYAGQGYGALGRQQVLSDNSTSGKVIFTGAGSDQSLVLRLPAEAKVRSSTIGVVGGAYGSDWWDLNWTQRVTVNVTNNKNIALGEILVDVPLKVSQYNVKSDNEFRVMYQSGGTFTERPAQIIGSQTNYGLITETRVVFKSLSLGTSATQKYYIYFSNPSPPVPSRVDLKANDIRNKPLMTQEVSITELAPTYFINPTAATYSNFGSTKRLVVADTDHEVVRLFDMNGTMTGSLGTFGVPGADNSHFDSPSGVAVGPDGKIYVSDTKNNRIQVFKPDLSYNMSIKDGTYVFSTSSNRLSSPHGIKVLTNGTIVLADTGNHIIQRFKPTGVPIDYFGNPGWTGSDNDYLNTPTDACVREDGYTMVTDANNNRVQVLNSGLKYMSTVGSIGNANGQFIYPSGIECSGGSVYVADTVNHRVQVFSDPGFTYDYQFGTTGQAGLDITQLNQPSGVFTDDLGFVYICDKGNNRILRIMDITVGTSTPEGAYPMSPTMDLGADGLVEWSHSGMLVGPIVTSDLSVRLNVAIYSATPTTDLWGNRIVDLPIKLTSNSQGALTLIQLDITYDIIEMVNATKVFSDRLAKADPSATNVIIPLKVTSLSGKVRLSNLTLVYDMPPTLVNKIPSNLNVDEDTSNAHLIDLSAYFKDDIDPKENLTFTIVSRTNETIIDTTIADGHFLSVDALNGTANDFWHGTVQLVVNCTNKRGLTSSSNKFTVTIRFQNHAPKFTSAPVLTAAQNQSYTYQAVAVDVDQDKVKYTLAFAPQGMTINATSGLVSWRPQGFQVGVQNVEILADDGDPLMGKSRQTFNITVANVNDPPQVQSTPFTEATVSEEYVYKVIASDEDNDNLTFSLLKAPSGMKIDPKTGEIHWTPQLGQSGDQKVSVGINDGTVTIKHDFTIKVTGQGKIAGIPLMYFVAGLLLLILIIIIVVVAVVLSRRRKARTGGVVRPVKGRRTVPVRKGRTLEEKVEAEGSSSAEVLGEEPPMKEPEECPKCGDLIEEGIGYCSSCGHVIKKEGEEIPKPFSEPIEEKVTTKVDPGPQRLDELPKFEAKDDAVEVTAPKEIVVEKDHTVPKVEAKMVDAVPKVEKVQPEPKPKKEEPKVDNRSLDDILKALKD